MKKRYIAIIVVIIFIMFPYVGNIVFSGVPFCYVTGKILPDGTEAMVDIAVANGTWNPFEIKSGVGLC